MKSLSESRRNAAKKALKIRQEEGIGFERPCDIYELISKRGLDLQFFAVPTLEGMYLEDGSTRRLCVSAFRPVGRQRFTAAHELGHCVLMHGTKVDTIESLKKIESDDLDEKLADTFASAIMMPNNAVHAGFRLRNMNMTCPSPTDVYRVATWLGVGYTTLIHHMFYVMRNISEEKHKSLLRREPKEIKTELVKQVTTKEVFVLDHLWKNCRVHAQVGDFLLGISNSNSYPIASEVCEGCVTATKVGNSIVTTLCGNPVYVSVCRESYIGFYEYRYLMEEE